MPFNIAFSPARPAPDQVFHELPDGADDYQTAVIQACSALSEVNGSRFAVWGFGRNPWIVDVAYDMSAFLEQLPELMDALRTQSEMSLEMYSQGIECTFSFEPAGDLMHVKCISHTSWNPTPDIEVIERLLLIQMLDRFVQAVATGLERVDPSLVQQAPFDSWLTGGLGSP